jgi:type IV pilus assembly protein PilQ
MFGRIHSQAIILVVGALFLSVPVIAVGQEEVMISESDVALAQAPPASLGGRPVSLDVQKADIGNVLRSLASFAGTNIVASPRVEGTVTVKLDDIPWRDALAVILQAHSFDFVEENGIIRVDTAEGLRDEKLAFRRTEKQIADLEPLVLDLVPLAFANAKEVQEALQKMLSERGNIDIDARTNTLLINDISSRASLLKNMAKNLDTMTPQVEINARLVDIDRRATQELGINWSIANIKDPSNNVVGSAAFNNPIADPMGDFRVGTVQSFGDLMVQIAAMESDNRAHLISNPVITTTNNREASILVGQKIPLIVTDQAGNAITQLTTIGIKMAVTPHINSTDRITLDIHNEVSDLSSQATVQGGVIINTSESDTRVLVMDGETAIIAGLIRNVESTLTSGIPVLKDIPVLGNLFRHSNRTTNERELIIFVTPRIVTDEYLGRDALTYESTSLASPEEKVLDVPAEATPH